MPTLTFKGKTFVQNHHLMLEHHQIEPDDARSFGDAEGLHGNLILQGDNLLALKALLPTYANRIKCIYIDPPYNTGNENWVYNDNVNSPMHQEWFRKVVGRDDLTRHDKWLCMMLPRLKLLRELLRDDGAIFISIDDNEVHHLRALMDEVFGENNFIATLVWQKKYAASNDAKYFSDNHDYIICYAKNIDQDMRLGWKRNLLPRTLKQDALYKYDNNDGKGKWRPDNLSVKTYSSAYYYPIINPATGVAYNPPRGRSWITNEETIQRWIDEERIFFGRDGIGAPQLKRYLNEVQSGIVPLTIWSYEDVGHSDEARKDLKYIFADVENPFDNPKPTRLIKRILQIATNPNDLILDSFAGSGTTAQAVLALNAEDGGNRRFILIEQEDYADTLTAERVRRVMRGIPDAKDETLRNGYGGSFTYARLGAPLGEQAMLNGTGLPSYHELARYVYFTTTGEQWDERKADLKHNFLGESRDYRVYMLYVPDAQQLRQLALTLDGARELGQPHGKTTLVIAPYKLVDDDTLRDCNVAFCQLPFEIYRFRV